MEVEEEEVKIFVVILSTADLPANTKSYFNIMFNA